MLKESYTYISFKRKTFHIFRSEGDNGSIPKMVIFSYAGKKLWNLGFGDLQPDGDIDDSIVSNNNDLIKVISTVAKIAYEFSDKYPLRSIQIKPVDEKRRKLYNHVFRRNYNIINIDFEIIGVNGRRGEDYSPKKFYESFKLNRRLSNEKE